MSDPQAYYANYGGLAVDEYVRRHVRGNTDEMARLRRMVELVPSHTRTLLDVGAGHGVFLQELQAARGIRGVGVEITAAKVDYARAQGVDLRLGDAAALAFEERSFDAIVCTEVLEHLPYGVYESALRELARVARLTIITSVPFDEARRFVRCPYCGSRVNPDYHFRSFAPGRIGALFPGFALEREWHLGRAAQPRWVQRLRRFVDRWPAMLVCPCCGWRPAASAGAVELSASSRARALVQRLPGPRRPQWLVGVYRREAGDA